MLSTDDTLAEIRRLYFETTKQTIERDLQNALELLKSLPSEEQRERAAVYMEGLAEMYKDWRKHKDKRHKTQDTRQKARKRH